jgi:DNA-binding SARP family transcriptional activator
MHTDTSVAGRSNISLRCLQPFVSGAIALRVLGEVELAGPRGTFSPGSARPGALLALLAIHAGECVPVDRLIDELWTSDARSSAVKRVQVNVLRLRRALGAVAPDVDPAALVRTGARGYSLELDPDRIDAVCFERLLGRGRGELAAGDPRRAAATLRDALALWRGTPYADFAYEPFASAEIRHLEELRACALELWAEAELALGGHAALAPKLERLVARDPLRERLRALLMVALYRCCRQAEALAVYQSARNDLVDGLGIEPGLELRALQRAILDQSPSLELASRDWRVAAAARPLAQVA